MTQPGPAEFGFDALDEFDDEALKTFLDPCDGGIEPADLGLACSEIPEPFISRIRSALPMDRRAVFDSAVRSAADPGHVAGARASILERLFWPLVYWTRPDEYEELIAGERIHPRLIAELPLDDAVVCDIGAGSGRFALAAAVRARQVIAVDEVPPLLDRLRRKILREGLDNVVLRRGGFSSLPLHDRSVDVAVACSAFSDRAPHGGDHALSEAERVVKPGGLVAIIWPQDPAWFSERGYTCHSFPGNDTVQFRDAETAERLCARYYSEEAAAWVREHRSSRVPYAVLGVKPPNDVCTKRITPSP